MNTRRGRAPILKPPVAYKFRKIFETNNNSDEVIDLTPAIAAPVSTEVVDAAQACSSGQTESASVDNRNEIVIENVAVTVIASDDPIGDNLDLVPARKRAKRDNSVPWMAHIQLFEICTLFFSRWRECILSIKGWGTRRGPPPKQAKRILGSSVSLTTKK